MAEITTYEAMPFPLAKPNKDTFVTKSSNIGHNDSDVGTELNDHSESITSLENTRPIMTITTLNGEYYLKIEYGNPSQSSAICGEAVCGYAVCGMS